MSKSSTMKPGASTTIAAKQTTARSRLTRNRKLALGAGAVVLAIGVLIVVARPDAAAQAPAPVVTAQQPGAAASAGQLTALRTKFNFGSISMAAGKVTHRYAISSAGTEPISVHKIYTSCMCTTAALVKNGKASEAFGMPGHTPIPAIDVPLEGKDRAFIEVIFDPAAHGPAGVGPIERVVTIENSAGQPLELQFAALVTP